MEKEAAEAFVHVKELGGDSRQPRMPTNGMIDAKRYRKLATSDPLTTGAKMVAIATPDQELVRHRMGKSQASRLQGEKWRQGSRTR